MKYQITSDNMKLTSSMEALTREKFTRLEKRFKDIPEDSKYVRVVLNKSSDEEQRFTVKSIVNIKGKEYYSEESDYNLETAIIKTVEEILRIMKKEKGRMISLLERSWDKLRRIKRG